MVRRFLQFALVVLMGATPACPIAAVAQVPGAAETPLRTGQRISLDLKGVDILDVLKLLSQRSGLNFVAGRNVSGRVTIFANDVDVWEAFELIADANDLAYEKRGDMVSVMMARDYELLYGEKFQERGEHLVIPLKYAKVVQAATVLNQIKSSVGRVVADEASNTLVLNDVPAKLQEMRDLLKHLDRPNETRVYPLSYAEAEQLKEKIQELLTPVGTFSFDARSNKVVVTDLPEVLKKVDRIIAAYDVPEGEVLIDSRIIKVELSDEFTYGIDWQQILGGIDARTRTNFRVLSDIVGGTATGAALRLATGSGNTDVVLEALKAVGKTETLANPRIMVANNQEARILVGTKEAFVTVTTTVPSTGSVVSSPEIQFVDVGTKLFVTPNVKRDGHVRLKIRPEVSTADVQTFSGNRIPIVTTTEAETTVLVKSGVTIIIGGLMDDSKVRNVSKIPILSAIPLLGLPFRSITETDNKTEIVVFLTPTVVLPDGTTPVPPPGTAMDPDMPGGAAQNAVTEAYQKTVRTRLQQQITEKFRESHLPAGSAVVEFTLHHTGAVSGAPSISSPDGIGFIQAATVAFTKAQPFPSFPEGTKATKVRFQIAVEYEP